jgi:hypothetical protein
MTPLKPAPTTAITGGKEFTTTKSYKTSRNSSRGALSQASGKDDGTRGPGFLFGSTAVFTIPPLASFDRRDPLDGE